MFTQTIRDARRTANGFWFFFFAHLNDAGFETASFFRLSEL